MRYEYHHSGDTMTSLVYSENGKLNQKYGYKYDKKGNQIEYSVYDAFGDSAQVKTLYKYRYDSFDDNGNWTKRTQFKVVTENGQAVEKPTSVRYRSITYFP
jgi:hypothetical protein